MNKNKTIIVNKRALSSEEFYTQIEKYVNNCRELTTIHIKIENSVNFICKLYAAVLSEKEIFLGDIESKEFSESLAEGIDKLSKKDILNITLSQNSFIWYKNISLPVEKYLCFIKELRNKNSFDKKDIFYSMNIFEEEITDFEEQLYKIFLLIFYPILNNQKIIISNSLIDVFKNHKPTIYIGNRREVKTLHSHMMALIHKNSLLENFYQIFKNWDNDILTAYFNKILFLKGYSSLKKIIINNTKDLKGLWIDFESMGIDIYSFDAMKNKNIEETE